jgi:type IV secretory pathway VirB10-like protein
MRSKQRIGLAAALWIFVIVSLTAVGGVGFAKDSSTAAQYQYGARGAANKKVTICHKNKVTITISKSALPAHLAHGDKVGSCDKKKKKQKAEAKAEKAKAKAEAEAEKEKAKAEKEKAKAEAKADKAKAKADAKAEKAEAKADKAEGKADKPKGDDEESGKSDEPNGKSQEDHGKGKGGDDGSNGAKGKKK